MDLFIETDRLRLRRWRMEDLEDFYNYAKIPMLAPGRAGSPMRV